MNLNIKNKKVAIIHDWLVVYGGAERVLEHMIDAYPDADIFSLMDGVPQAQRHFLRGKTPKTSFMQKIPGVHKHYRKMLPLMPYAIEQLDLSAYDLVLSSSYSVAKGVITGPNQLHVCYCHSPMRYAWDHYHFYLRETGLDKGLLSVFARWQMHKIRNWDARNSLSVDRFLANSRFVRERIWKFYRRGSELVYPPIDTSLFQLHSAKEDFYVAAGRFVPFKRIDLVAQAFANMPDKKLVLIGDGPEMEKIKEKAQGSANIQFLGFQPPAVMRDYLSRAQAFIFPSEEDFGIVPVEAQACGTPVIAFGKGGALETVKDYTQHPQGGATGIFFHEQSAQSLKDAVLQFESLPTATFSAAAIAEHAAEFSPKRFKQELQEQVEAAWVEKQNRMLAHN